MKTKTEIDNELTDQSVAHWERMRDDPRECREFPGSKDCPLCRKYLKWPSCIGCPVAESTGKDLCVNTPYISAHFAYFALFGKQTPENLTAWRTAAQAEIDFLKGLKK